MARDREGRRDEDDSLYEDNLRAMGKGEKETAYLFATKANRMHLWRSMHQDWKEQHIFLEAVSEERS